MYVLKMKAGDMDYNKTQKKDEYINVKISSLVLTPFTCASLVNEILKGILYQRSQIPYPYSWMKSVVNKKRQTSDTKSPNISINFSAANYFRVVSSAYDILENIMKGIIKEFSDNSNCLKEVVFLFGTTPHCPKEVFTIDVSSIAKGHSERNHLNQIGQYQQKILRNIFLSQGWLDSIDASAPCTNTYIFLKKLVPKEDCSRQNSDNFFIPTRPLSFSENLKQIKIVLDYEHSENGNCCHNLSVFEDVRESDVLSKQGHVMTDDKEFDKCIMWYQSKDLLKGFKDCYINKVSACELW